MKRTVNDNPLNFVAVLTPEEISEAITGIKHYFEKTYGVKKALNAPPHITLIPPFRWQLSKMEILHTSLRKFSERAEPFPVVLRGFGAFKPRVIFVAVPPAESLQLLWQDLAVWIRDDIQLGNGPDKRGFHPHVTVAFKDLNAETFRKAWPEFREKHIEMQFTVDHIALLRHTGKRWEIVRRFPFSGQIALD